MALEQTSGVRRLQQLMETGNFANKAALKDWIVNAADMGVLPFSQNDMYQFFVYPEEKRKQAAAEARLMDMIGEGVVAGQQQSPHLARRLGFGGTSLGEKVGGALGSADMSQFSRAINESRAGTTKDIVSGDRMGDIDLVGDAFERGTTRRGGIVRRGGKAVGTAAGSALGLAGLAFGPLAPIASLILTGVGMGIGGKVGTAAGEAEEAKFLAKEHKRLRKFKGKPVGFAKYSTPTTALGGSEFLPTGSNQRALSGAFGEIEEDQDYPFLFGSSGSVRT